MGRPFHSTSFTTCCGGETARHLSGKAGNVSNLFPHRVGSRAGRCTSVFSGLSGTFHAAAWHATSLPLAFPRAQTDPYRLLSATGGEYLADKARKCATADALSR